MKKRFSILLIIFLLSGIISVAYAAPPPQEGGAIYVVQEGDTLWELAEKFLGNGNQYNAIITATNEKYETDSTFTPITDSTDVKVGSKIFIPASVEPVPTVAPEKIGSEILVDGLQFPEGPFWSILDNRLYFLEWSGDKVWVWEDGQAEIFLETGAGSGPSGIWQDQAGNFWLALYSGLKVVQYSPDGELLTTIDNYNGEPFRGPNDLVVDANGGVYFTDSGNFEDDWTTGRPVGAIYYYTPEGELLQVDSELSYPNGIALGLDGQILVVNEHRQNRMLRYNINPDGTLSEPAIFHELDDNYRVDAEYSYELGPDGMWQDSQGNYWVAHYAGGKIVVLNAEGQLLQTIPIPEGRYPTNTTLGPDEQSLYVTESETGRLYRIDVSDLSLAVPEKSSAQVLAEGLQFPEAPFWSTVDNRLYFLEWSGDKIWAVEDGQAEVLVETGPGTGPSGLWQDQAGNFWVALYSDLKVVKLNQAGEVLLTIDNYNGEPFRGPNDLVVDANGGVYFTDSGNFEDDWTTGRAVGAVYYYTPQGELLQVDTDLSYPNGIALSLDGQSLIVNEHRQNRVLRYNINPDGTLSDRQIFFEMDEACLLAEESCYELGPDGMWRDSQGNYWIAHYGGGKVVVLNQAGELLRNIPIPAGSYPTNTTLGPEEQILYVTESETGRLYRLDITETEASEAVVTETIVDNLQFPEGPFWSPLDNRLYFLEWSGDRIWLWQEEEASVFLETETGSGPSGLWQDEAGNFWVALYSGLKVVQLDRNGETLLTIDNYNGEPFRGPNDLVVDANGGVYFTDSGNFEDDWTTGRAVGAVYYYTPEGELLQVDSELSYPNGIALSLDGQNLIVNEHRQNRVLRYSVNPDGTLSEPELFFQMDEACLLAEESCYELGPDGMWRDSQDNYWIAHYGGGKVVVVSAAGQLLQTISLPEGRYPTNTTLGPAEKTLYVTESETGRLYRMQVNQGQ